MDEYVEALKDYFRRTNAAERDAFRALDDIRNLPGNWEDPELKSLVEEIQRKIEEIRKLEADRFACAGQHICELREERDILTEQLVNCRRDEQTTAGCGRCGRAYKLERYMLENRLLSARVKELTREVENFKGYRLGGNR